MEHSLLVQRDNLRQDGKRILASLRDITRFVHGTGPDSHQAVIHDALQLTESTFSTRFHRMDMVCFEPESLKLEET